MPEEPFALSTLPSPLPAERDYDDIHSTVMESARGRWFLDEYARRNRHADTRTVLAAIERLELVIRGSHGQQLYQGFRAELLDMARTIAQTRAEVGESKPAADAPGDAVTSAATPASATPDVFAAAQRIQDVVWTMRERGLDPATCEQIETLAATILSASSLRDPNDHRTRKLGAVLQYLEQRIDVMLGACTQAAEAAGAAGEAPPAVAGDGPVGDAPAEQAAPELARFADEFQGPEAASDRPEFADDERAESVPSPQVGEGDAATEPALEERWEQIPQSQAESGEPIAPAPEHALADAASTSDNAHATSDQPVVALAAEMTADASVVEAVTAEADSATPSEAEPLAAMTREPAELELEPLVVVPIKLDRRDPEAPPAELEHAPIAVEPLFATPTLAAPAVADAADFEAATTTFEAVSEPAPESAMLAPAVVATDDFEPAVEHVPEPAEPPAAPVAEPPVSFVAAASAPSDAEPAAEVAMAESAVAAELSGATLDMIDTPAAPEQASSKTQTLAGAWENATTRPEEIDMPSEPPATRPETEPADFLLEPASLPIAADAASPPAPAATEDQTAAPSADAIAEIERELFALSSDTPLQAAPEPAAAAPAPLAAPVVQALTPAAPIAPARATPEPMPKPMPLPNDPLAALMAMSDEERIALFT